MEKQTAKSMRKRMFTILVAIVVLFTVIVGRLFFIQIIQGEKYQNTAINQQTRELTVAARRGTIYDRNGKALAVSATAYKVVLSPATTDEDAGELILKNLPQLLGVEPEKIEKSLAKNSYYDVVARRVEQNVADDVRAFVRENKLGGSISIVDDPKRYYPYNDFACHVLGFVGTDNQGLTGLEVMYEEYLRGTDGKIVLATDAVGNDLSLLDYEKYI
ncbi:MAG: stage V sporulation protein D, partial [Clostridia bacterium]|nr:stage V sporulation protein D [Clostridia bacterium]